MGKITNPKLQKIIYQQKTVIQVVTIKQKNIYRKMAKQATNLNSTVDKQIKVKY